MALMTDAEKAARVKLYLGITDNSQDALINAYVEDAGKEILGWRYSYATNIPAAVPVEYETTQIQAVLAGYGIRGAEGQTSHNENGISREFKYDDMVAYIRSHVITIARTI